MFATIARTEFDFRWSCALTADETVPTFRGWNFASIFTAAGYPYADFADSVAGRGISEFALA